MSLISKRILQALLSCLIVLGCGCSTQSVKPSQAPVLPAQEVEILNAELERLFESEKLNLKKAEKLKVKYQSLLTASPEYAPAQLGLYRLSYEMEISVIDIDNQQQVIDAQRQLIRLYLKMPKAVRSEILPPTMMLYQAKYPDYVLSSNPWLSTQYYMATGKKPRAVTKDDLYQLVLLSAKTSPDNYVVRGMVAEHAIDVGHPEFAIAALKQLIKQAPHSPFAYAFLADYYTNKAWNSACPNEQRDTLKNALGLYKKILEIDQVLSLDVRQQTAIIYTLLGLRPLALNEAKILVESDDYKSILRAAYIFTQHKKLDLAEAAFNKGEEIYDFKTNPQDRAYVNYLMASGRWGEVAQAYKKYLENQAHINSWDTLYAALIAKKLKSLGYDIEYKDIHKVSLKTKTVKYDLAEALNDILHDREQELQPTNACDQQRLVFYRGASAVLNHGDYAAGREAAEAIRANLVPFGLESQIFEQILLAK